MATFETAETQIPQTDLRLAYMEDPSVFDTPVETQAAHDSWRNRLLHTRAGHIITAAATTLGFGGAGELALASPASAATAPETPGHVMNQLSNAFNSHWDIHGNAMVAVDQKVWPHKMDRQGDCSTYDNLDPNAPYVGNFIDQPSSFTWVYCFNGADGKPKTLVQPRNEFMGNPKLSQPTDYQPLMNTIGTQAARAARSARGAHISSADRHHGTVSYIHATPTETDINYRKQSGRHLGWQMKQLKLLQQGNQVIARWTKY